MFDVESFTIEGDSFNAAAVHEEPNPMLYPMCTVGIVFNSNGRRGSGVLVGPNLLLTAGHVAPWGAASWSMEFIPAYRNGVRPFGSSFVQSYHGYNPGGDATGYDYVICKLYNPLGHALGRMGSASFGNEDDYYNKRFVSSGYPGSYGERPAVELDMAVADIDNDSPGKELEFGLRGISALDGRAGRCGTTLAIPTSSAFSAGRKRTLSIRRGSSTPAEAGSWTSSGSVRRTGPREAAIALTRPSSSTDQPGSLGGLRRRAGPAPGWRITARGRR